VAVARTGFRASLAGPRMVALFLLGVLLFNFPFLAVFSVSRSLGGIPVLYLYLFAAWSLLIFLAFLIVRRRD
jgi:hypothetical protein